MRMKQANTQILCRSTSTETMQRGWTVFTNCGPISQSLSRSLDAWENQGSMTL